jgi:hypothetical protein
MEPILPVSSIEKRMLIALISKLPKTIHANDLSTRNSALYLHEILFAILAASRRIDSGFLGLGERNLLDR